MNNSYDGSRGSNLFNCFQLRVIIFYSSLSQIVPQYHSVSTIDREKLCKLLLDPTAWCDKALPVF